MFLWETILDTILAKLSTQLSPHPTPGKEVDEGPRLDQRIASPLAYETY